MSEISPLPHDHHKSFPSTVQQLPEAMRFEPVAQVFKQLSDACRCRIFLLLCHSEECVINIASMVGMSSPAVSHHLKQLKAGHLITSRRSGKEMYYKAAETEQAQLLHHVIEQIVQVACLSKTDGE